ncbi:MAG: hypothetical protein Fur0032_09880 [Terrimicrobiaceae bacterium]
MSTATLRQIRKRERKKLARALLVSILLHLFLILGVAVMMSLRPPPAPPEEPETVTITMVEPPPRPAEKTPFLATTESQRSEKPPDRADFESDKDTQAASERPAEGRLPLPSQDGEESPALAFENREYTPGREPRESAPSAPTAPPSPRAAKPAPEEEPKPTPRPDTDLAVLKPARPKSQPTPSPKSARPEQPAQPPSPEGFQPQTRVTRLKGGISNRGRSSAAAAATPLGRYRKRISDAIGSRWYYYVSDALSLMSPGTVEIRFTVLPDGKVKIVDVLRNSSNTSFEATSVRAIMEAEIPPIPPDLLPVLEGGRIEVDFSFSILSR